MFQVSILPIRRQPRLPRIHWRFGLLAVFVAFSLICAGCATPHKKGTKRKTSTYGKPSSKKKQKAKPVERQPSPVIVDTAAQQAHYDKGLQHYAAEEYREAKKAWQEVIRLGPNSPLATNARENIKRTDQILKTLNEMENP